MLSPLLVDVLVGPNIKIRSDLASCGDVPPIKIKVPLADPLAYQHSTLPNLDDLHMYTTSLDASIDMLRSVRETLKHNTRQTCLTWKTLFGLLLLERAL